jgi:Kef-type K+ transport system membrane component KefB
VAVVAKAAGCSLGAVGLPLRERASVGAGMIPRGEVTLDVAASGLASGDLASPLYSALLAIVLVSALAAPLLLKATTPSAGRPGAGRPIDVPPEASGREGEPGEGREGP